jgi:hypothetical protein
MWVPPFGDLRVNGCLLLTAAFRSLPRRILCLPLAGGDHSSSPDVTNGIERSTRKCRPDGSELSAGRRSTLPYLILHHEEFAWPRMSPPTPVSSYLTISPITRTRYIGRAGLFSVALVVARACGPAPGSYPARYPTVFGLSSIAVRQ